MRAIAPPPPGPLTVPQVWAYLSDARSDVRFIARIEDRLSLYERVIDNLLDRIEEHLTFAAAHQEVAQ